MSELPHIKRKVNEYSVALENFKGDQKTMLNEYNKLKSDYQEIEESLNIVASQNKRLVENNKELVRKLYFAKKEYENRIKKVLFCFYVNSNYHNEKVTLEVKNVLETANLLKPETIDETNCLLLCNQIKIIVKQLTKKLIFAPEKNVKVLDKLVEIYIKHINDNIAQEKTTINWRTILNDMFKDNSADNLASISVPEPFSNSISKMKKSSENSLNIQYKQEPDLSFLDKSSFKDNKSSMNSKSVSVNEEDLLGEITRKLANAPQSLTDSFIASDANSLHLFSPRSERSSVLKF